jgi:glycine oxidase
MGRPTDFLIVGGGVIGLAIARELRRRGAGSIRVLEKGQPGREASWAAAGILAPQVEADADGEFFRLCYESNQSYDEFAAELFEETGVDIELDRHGVIYSGFNERDEEEFDRRFTWQTNVGLNVKKLTSLEVSRLEARISDRVTCGLLFPDDGQVENRKLVEALVEYAARNSIDINCGVEATSIAASSDSVQVVVGGVTYKAATVVVATGAWTSLIQMPENTLTVQVKPIRGQMICCLPQQNFSHVVYSRRGYVVPRNDGRLLVGATVEDVGFNKSVTDEGIEHLLQVGTEISPMLRGLDIIDRWAGLRPYAFRDEPFVGKVPGTTNVFAAVGHYRNGILLTPITAKMIADQVLAASTQINAINS